MPATPALVVATPGAEPVAAGGYAAALLLDGWALLARPDLRAGEEALRRWLGAAALVRSADQGGVVVVLADPALVPVQALVRWDPAGHAARELADRADLALPPAARVASITGTAAAVREILDALGAVPTAAVLGPVPRSRSPRPEIRFGRQAADSVRAVVRVDRAQGPALARALRAPRACAAPGRRPTAYGSRSIPPSSADRRPARIGRPRRPGGRRAASPTMGDASVRERVSLWLFSPSACSATPCCGPSPTR